MNSHHRIHTSQSDLAQSCGMPLGDKEQLVWKYLEAGEPGMVHMEGEIIINRPVDVVFDFVADARNEPRYNPRILCAEKTSNGPIGLGTQFRSETSSMGRTTQWTVGITKYERPRLLASSIHSSSADIQGTQTFDPLDGGTRMWWLWELKPRGVSKLMTPLIGRMGQRLEERNWRNLKHFLEAQEAQGLLNLPVSSNLSLVHPYRMGAVPTGPDRDQWVECIVNGGSEETHGDFYFGGICNTLRVNQRSR